MKKIFGEDNKNQEINLYSYLYKKNFCPNVDNYLQDLRETEWATKNKYNKEKNIKNSYNILSLNEKMIIFPKDEINIETQKSRQIICEFAIPIFHYYRSNKKSTYLFRDFYHIKINEFPVQYVILNNIYDMTAKQLYEYIWNLNILFMNHPNIDTNNFWWNKENENLQNEHNEENIKENVNKKNCYPFVLRY